MTASKIVDEYLARLRNELDLAEAEDTEDIVAEFRSLLMDAAGDDPDAIADQIERLGEPEALARGILVERGLDTVEGVSSRVWWRLGIAAPTDIAIGLSLPLAVAIPVAVITRLARPGLGLVLLAAGLTVASLAWPFFIWRPWRRGGRSLSPGMTLTGLAVVRAPGSWRLVPLRQLRVAGMRPRRRTGAAVVIALISATLLAAAATSALDLGVYWFATRALDIESAERDPETLPPSQAEVQQIAQQVYDAARRGDGGGTTYLPSDGSADLLSGLGGRLVRYDIRSVKASMPYRNQPGVYQFVVQEYADGPVRVGASRFTISQRRWPTGDGRLGTDWIVIDIADGLGTLGG